jgi:hypothetical protein
MRTLASWLTFAAAVVSFSRLWQGVRGALEGQRLYGPLEALFWIGLFMGSMGYMAFVIYAADRAAGRSMRSIGLFDRLMARARPGSEEASVRER